MNLVVVGGISKSLFTNAANIPKRKNSNVGLVILEMSNDKSTGILFPQK
jgi:hypothetical protein